MPSPHMHSSPPTALSVRRLVRFISPLLAAVILSACERDPDPAPADAIPAPAPVENKALRTATEHAWQLADTQLSQCHEQAETLNNHVATLLQMMDDVSLQQAKDAWHKSHNCIQQLTPFFLLGDVSPGLFAPIRDLSFVIDAWPIQPGYLDYLNTYPHSGIVNDIAMPLTASALRQQHGFSDNSDVSLGFHAIAYILWGEQGDRPVTDFIADGEVTEKQKASGLSPIDLPNSRRRTLLQLQTQLLTDDIKALQLQLHPATNTLSLAYQRLSPESRLQLWQKVAEYQIKSDVMDTQVSILSAGEGLPDGHNQFAGHTSQSLIASLMGLEKLLFNTAVEQTALSSFLLEEKEQQALQKALQQAQQQLQQLASDWPAVGEKRLQPLMKALSDAANLLTPSVTSNIDAKGQASSNKT